jgi:hypothetical protein
MEKFWLQFVNAVKVGNVLKYIPSGKGLGYENGPLAGYQVDSLRLL